jgi:predicted glycosyltransferase
MFVFILLSAFVKKPYIVIVSSNVCSKCFEILKKYSFQYKIIEYDSLTNVLRKLVSMIHFLKSWLGN